MQGQEKDGTDAELGRSGSAVKNATGDRLAVCQNPHGLHEHVEVDGLTPERCFADCDCAPRLYVALDAVLDVVGQHAFSKYDAADNVRRSLIRRFARGEAT